MKFCGYCRVLTTQKEYVIVVFKKEFAICLLLHRQQDKHITTSQGLDCVPGSNFTGMWCETTTSPKRYIYNTSIVYW